MGPYLGIQDMGLGLDNKLGIRNRGLIKDHENNEFSWFLIKPLAKWLFLHIKLYHLDQGLQKLHKVGGVEFHAHADGVSGQIIQMPPGDQAWPEVPEVPGRDHLEPGQAVLVKCIDGYWEFMIDQSEFTCHECIVSGSVSPALKPSCIFLFLHFSLAEQFSVFYNQYQYQFHHSASGLS